MSNTAIATHDYADVEQHDVVRANSLRSLVAALKAFTEEDTREQFTELFARATRVLEVDDLSLARALRVSRPTISRWAAGKSAPHPLGRKPVFELLIRQAQSRLRRLTG